MDTSTHTCTCSVSLVGLKSLVSKSNRSSPGASKSPKGKRSSRRNKDLRSASMHATRGSMERRNGGNGGSSGGNIAAASASRSATPKARTRRFSLKSPSIGFKRRDSNSSLNSSDVPTSYVPNSLKSPFGSHTVSNARVSPSSTHSTPPARRKSVHTVPQTSLKRSLLRSPVRNVSASSSRASSAASPQCPAAYAEWSSAATSRATSRATTETGTPPELTPSVSRATTELSAVGGAPTAPTVSRPPPVLTNFSAVQSMYAEPGTPSLCKVPTDAPMQSMSMFAEPAISPVASPNHKGAPMHTDEVSATPPVSKASTGIPRDENKGATPADPVRPLLRAASTTSSTYSYFPSQMLSMYAEPGTPSLCRTPVDELTPSAPMHIEPAPTALTRTVSVDSSPGSPGAMHGPSFAAPTPPPSHCAPSRPDTPRSISSCSAPRVQNLSSTPVRTPRTCTNAQLQRTSGSGPRFRPPNRVETFTFDEILQTRPPSIATAETADSIKHGSKQPRQAKHARTSSFGGRVGTPPKLASTRNSSRTSSSSWTSVFNALTDTVPSTPKSDAPIPQNAGVSPHERSRRAKHKKHRSAMIPDNLVPSKRTTHNVRPMTPQPGRGGCGGPSLTRQASTSTQSAPHSPTNSPVPWTLFHRKPGYREIVVDHEKYYDANYAYPYQQYDVGNLAPPRGRSQSSVDAHERQRLPRLSLSLASTKSAPSSAPKRPSLRLMSQNEVEKVRANVVSNSGESLLGGTPQYERTSAICSGNPPKRLAPPSNLSASGARQDHESAFLEESFDPNVTVHVGSTTGAQQRNDLLSTRPTKGVTLVERGSTSQGASHHASESQRASHHIDGYSNSPLTSPLSPRAFGVADHGPTSAGGLAHGSHPMNASAAHDSISFNFDRATDTSTSSRVFHNSNRINSSDKNNGANSGTPQSQSTSPANCDNDTPKSTPISTFDKARSVFLSLDELDRARSSARASHRARTSRANFRLRLRTGPKLSVSRAHTNGHPGK